MALLPDLTSALSQTRIDRWAGIALVTVLMMGCFAVLRPLFDDHKDPFDRLLVAQSLSEPLILLTTDAKLARYGSTIKVVQSGPRKMDQELRTSAGLIAFLGMTCDQR